MCIKTQGLDFQFWKQVCPISNYTLLQYSICNHPSLSHDDVCTLVKGFSFNIISSCLPPILNRSPVASSPNSPDNIFNLWYSKPLKVGSIWHWYISTANALHRGIQVVKALFYNTCTTCTQRKRKLHQWLPQQIEPM